jgi:hypothetical protein
MILLPRSGLLQLMRFDILLCIKTDCLKKRASPDVPGDMARLVLSFEIFFLLSIYFIVVLSDHTKK